MTHEELIVRTCDRGRISERELTAAFPGIDLFCRIHPVSIFSFMDGLVARTKNGMSFHKAVNDTKVAYK